MITMRMMQVAVDEIINVLSVGNGFMAAARSMDMGGIMPRAAVFRRTGSRIGGAYLDDMFVHMIAMRVMQVPVVKVVDMIAVADSRMTAARLMLVVVIEMMRQCAMIHNYLLENLLLFMVLTGMLDGIADKLKDVIV